MKRGTLIILAATLFFAACQKVETPLVKENILSVVIEQDEMTRTEMDGHNNILWNENDQIIAFLKTSYGHKYQVKPAFVGKSYADFSMVSSSSGNDLSAGNEWEHNIAYYPYSDAVECLKFGNHYVLDVVLRPKQDYLPESFGNGSMAMVAVSEDNNITFKNVCGGMKLQLKGTQTVSSIKLEGKNGEKLSGAATVTAYTDETTPAITMASGASTVVTLNCGSGVKLNEDTATEFIIVLPPVLFSKGFTVVITDADGKTYTVETDKANTVLRSCILAMPAFKLGDNPSEEQPGGNEELIIPVSYVNLNSVSLKLYEGDIAQLTATVGPKDATDKTVVWSSDNPVVASVDQTGIVTALSVGTAKVTAAAGGKVATCTVIVSSLAVATADYIDEYGINHGKGTAVGTVIWAPVNCGYHKDDYKYGKLYQWGRKYGQGYSGDLYDIDGNTIDEATDATVPTIEEGGVSVITGNHQSKANIFYTDFDSHNWADPSDDKLWNSGTESKPVKTEYDPCPQGWRVPTYAELNELSQNHSSWTTDTTGKVGLWFSGSSAYTSDVPQVFFTANGYRSMGGSYVDFRGYSGHYWSSMPCSNKVYSLYFNSAGASVKDNRRANGYSVRCVQE